MKNMAPMAPTSIWPSAPTFQKRILKAGARPMAMQVRIIMSRRKYWKRLPNRLNGSPKVPFAMET